MPEPRDGHIEEDLEIAWHFQCESSLRDKLKLIWSTVDGYLTVLKTGVVLTGIASRSMFNKPRLLLRAVFSGRLL
jgi:hypothetical protein